MKLGQVRIGNIGLLGSRILEGVQDVTKVAIDQEWEVALLYMYAYNWYRNY